MELQSIDDVHYIYNVEKSDFLKNCKEISADTKIPIHYYSKHVEYFVDYMNNNILKIPNNIENFDILIQLFNYMSIDLLKIIESMIKPVDIYDLCLKGEYDIVKKMRNYNVNDGLRGACKGGHMNIIELMIKNGSKKFNEGLCYACEGGHKHIVELMLDLRTDDCFRGFYIACREGHKDIVELFISRQSDITNLNIGFLEACEQGHKEIVQLLISHGANKLNKGLQKACQGNHKKIIDLLIYKGATDWNLGLQGSCKGGHLDLAKEMIDRLSKEITGNDTKQLDLALDSASVGGNIEIVKILLTKEYSDIDYPLRNASRKGHIEIVELLISSGATDLDKALSVACEDATGDDRYTDIVKLLISKGAKTLNEALKVACRYGRAKIVKLLISEGAEALDKGMEEVFHYGYIMNDFNYKRYIPIIKLLVSNGLEHTELSRKTLDKYYHDKRLEIIKVWPYLSRDMLDHIIDLLL